MTKHLISDHFFNWDNPVISEWLVPIKSLSRSAESSVLSLYLKVRDEISYNPFDIRLEKEKLGALTTLEKGYGHCIDKSILFIACCRSLGVPAKIGLARVRNHIGTASLEKRLGSSVLVPHGYADVLLWGKWVKCTPAFNASLCYKLGVEPLTFDGKNDSIFQPIDASGRLFMEYLEDYGSFEEVPIDLIRAKMFMEYPDLFDDQGVFRLPD